MREIVGRPASLLLTALAIFLATLVTLGCGNTIIQALLASMRVGALPSWSTLAGVTALGLLSWSAAWPLVASALRHVETGKVSSLWPDARQAGGMLILGTMATMAKLVAILLLVTAGALMLHPASPVARSLLAALIVAPTLLFLIFADCVTWAALPSVSQRGLRAVTPALLAVLRFPHHTSGIFLLTGFLLTPLLLLALPLAIGAVRWPPTPASLFLLLGFSLCLAPAPLLLSKTLSAGLLARQDRDANRGRL
ncbi:MAG: hypothetical protein JRH20_12550 [Deltaproteobacteria bacterium]|nr:hypothetical protein [Deltaproteobacteria bacterium]